jgi:ankyrin repeat protein
MIRRALSTGSDVILSALIDSRKVEIGSPIGLFGSTILHWAAMKGKTNLIQELVSIQEFGLTEQGHSALDYAIYYQQEEAIQVLSSYTRCSERPRELRVFPIWVVVKQDQYLEWNRWTHPPLRQNILAVGDDDEFLLE